MLDPSRFLARSLSFQQVAWPVFGPAPNHPGDIQKLQVRRFVSHEGHGRILAEILEIECARWDPKSFTAAILPLVAVQDRELVIQGVEIVYNGLSDAEFLAPHLL